MPIELHMTETPTVLIVDDNRPLADGFARALPDEYDVVTAYTGEQARESLHEGVDAVLLDRRLPDVSGDDILDEIREGDYDCRVAVVSADERPPDYDCETYLTKPLAGRDVIRETVADLLDLNASA